MFLNFMRRSIFTALAGILSFPVQANPSIGMTPPTITLDGENGGRVDGAPWTSASIKDKVLIFFYIDPSHRNDNEELKAALKSAAFPADKVASIAVINMAASWLPNAILNASLKDNQRKYPEVVYVKDMNSTLVKNWNMEDKAFNMLLFDRQGKVLYSKSGDFSANDTAEVISVIRKNMKG